MIGLKSGIWNSVSGMKASQAGLATVGHNLANADNEGYSRQRTSIGARMPARLIAGTSHNFAGQGAQLNNITRAQSTFLERQLLRDRMEKGFFEGRAEALTLLERIADQGVGSTINDRMDAFFNATRELSQDATSFGSRTVFVEASEEMAGQFREAALESRLLQEDIDRSLEDQVRTINRLAAAIADTNARVGVTEGVGVEANDARDQREQAIRELGDMINVRVRIQDNGTLDVDIGNGFSLVSGNLHASLEAVPDPGNNALVAIQHLSLNGRRTDITQRLSEGSVGGLLDVRDNVIPDQMAKLDTLAFNFVNEANTVHSAGFGLDGVGGRDLFDPIAVQAGAAANVQVNQALIDDPLLVAAATDVAALPGDNRNLLELADLQDDAFVALGDVTFSHFFAETIRSVGESGRSNAYRLEVHEARLEQSEALKSSITGVSVDDEMVDLTRFQKHFEASARVLTTVNRLMDEVLRLVG